MHAAIRVPTVNRLRFRIIGNHTITVSGTPEQEGIPSWKKSWEKAKCSTNPLTLEWIEKAEEDFKFSGRELRARRAPNYDAPCFHS